MRKIVEWILVIGLAFTPVLFSAPAEATNILHTWVASNGSDANNCDRPTPCATFTSAYSKTVIGGEISCVDSAYFGELVISNSITVDCESATYSSLGSGVISQFFIHTPAAGVVVLRGLDLVGADLSGAGLCTEIFVTGAGVLHLEKVKINDNGSGCTGISYAPTGPAKFFISDSNITNNGATGTDSGIDISPASGVEADIVIDHTHIDGNYFGIIADGNSGGIIHGVIRDSVVSGNTENGITASTTSSNVLLLIDQSTVSGNVHGLVAGGANAAIMVRNTSVFGNTTAGLFTVNGGQLFSYGNNSVDGNNGNNGAFTGMATLK
jgi:hypothetical protein